MRDFFSEAARKLTEISNEKLAKQILKGKKKHIITEIKANAYQGKSNIYLLKEPEKEIKNWLEKLGYHIYLSRGDLWVISWEK